MTDNIFKTFNDIADWLSNWRPGGRKDFVDVSQILRDPVWKQKKLYSTAVFIEFNRYLDLQQISTDLSFSEKREKSGKNLLDVLEDDIPFYPPPEHPLNENFDRFGTGEAYPLWNEVFAELLSENYYPPQSQIGLQTHLWAVHLFYSDIIKRLDKISLSVLFRIDLAFTIATGNALAIIRGIQIKGEREGDLIFNLHEKERKKRSKNKQETLRLFETIKSRSEIRPYFLAQKIQKRWTKTGPKDKIPHVDTILRFLREGGRVSPVRRRNVCG